MALSDRTVIYMMTDSAVLRKVASTAGGCPKQKLLVNGLSKPAATRMLNQSELGTPVRSFSRRERTFVNTVRLIPDSAVW